MTNGSVTQKMKMIIVNELIEQKIFLIRGEKVMLSNHLAELYGVETRVLVQALKRNRERFPSDFMFQLAPSEFRNLKSQIVISSWGGSRRALPYAFTEQGVAMLSSILRSRKAIHVNIAIMRTFVKLRKLIATSKIFTEKLNELEQKYQKHDKEIFAIFEAIRQLMTVERKHKQKIGFKS